MTPPLFDKNIDEMSATARLEISPKPTINGKQNLRFFV
jgi:hypothetical protein